jgi:GMP synthase (glutamine-hydrolysing)
VRLPAPLLEREPMPELLDASAILHDLDEGLARFRPALEAAGFRCVERLREVGPDDDRAPLVVVMGGPMGVYEADRYPFLAAEQDLLRARLAAGRPSVGICLGSQLLAAAAGSTVRKGAHGTFVGVEPVHRFPAALNDSLLREVPDAFDVVQWHGDTFDPVPGMQLFQGAPYPAQGFRVGRSVGLQFHPELGPEDFQSWVESTAGALRESGRDPDALLTQGLPRLRAGLPVLDRLLHALARDGRRFACP